MTRYIVHFQGQGYFGLDTVGDAYFCPEPAAHVFTTLEEASHFAKDIGTVIPVHVTRGVFNEHIRYIIARDFANERKYRTNKQMWVKDIGKAIMYREYSNAYSVAASMHDINPKILMIKVLETP